MKKDEEFYRTFLPPEWNSILPSTARRLLRDMVSQISGRIFFEGMTEELLAKRSELSLAELKRLFRGDTRGFSLARLCFHSQRFHQNSPKLEPMTEPKELGQPIASREFSLSGQKTVTVTFGMPVLEPVSKFFQCPYFISGLSKENLRWGTGVDAVQAIYMAMVVADTDLRYSDEGRAGKISWPGSEDAEDFGFPVIPKRKERPFAERYKKFKRERRMKKK